MAALLAKMQSQAQSVQVSVGPSAAPSAASAVSAAPTSSSAPVSAEERAYLGYNAADEAVAEPAQEVAAAAAAGPAPAYARPLYAAAKKGDADALKEIVNNAGATPQLDYPVVRCLLTLQHWSFLRSCSVTFRMISTCLSL